MSKRTKPKITSERPIGKDVDLQREDVRLLPTARVRMNSSTTSSKRSDTEWNPP